MSDNVTPIPTPKAVKPKRGPKAVAQALGCIQKKVHVLFCTLEAVSACLEKAENDDDVGRWIRSARVVERCVEDLESLRSDVDDACDLAAHVEAAP